MHQQRFEGFWNRIKDNSESIQLIFFYIIRIIMLNIKQNKQDDSLQMITDETEQMKQNKIKRL